MKHKLLAVCIAALLCSINLAAAKPNFSGTWVMDKNRSFSNPAGLDQTLTVAHDGDRVKVEAKLVLPQGERVINEEYSLDGKGAEFAPPGAPPGAKGKRRAYWLPDGRGIVVEDETTTDSPNGPVTQQTVRKWTLSADGLTLTVDYHFDGPRGGGEAKRVFVKK
jgi:hypothetical protein